LGVLGLLEIRVLLVLVQIAALAQTRELGVLGKRWLVLELIIQTQLLAKLKMTLTVELALGILALVLVI
jgi:hypothetical protein